MNPRTRTRTLLATGVVMAVLLLGSCLWVMFGVFGPAAIRHTLDNGALVSSDGRTVTVSAFLGCFENSERATATESADEVRVLVSTRRGLALACEGEWTGMPVHLDQPLGDRAIVDAVTGRALIPLDERKVLRPSVLPAGHRFDRDRLGHLLGYPCWEQQYSNDNNLLRVDQCPSPPSTASSSPSAGNYRGLVVAGQPQVRGTTGALLREPEYGSLQLRWSEAGWDFSIVTEEFSGSGHGLDEADLLAVADGLR